MVYLELIQDKRVECPILPQLIEGRLVRIQSEKQFAELEDMQMGNYTGEDWEEECDLLWEPTLLCSDLLKRDLAAQEGRIAWKAVYLLSKKPGKIPLGLCWIPWFPVVDGLSAETVRYPNGLWKKVLLDQEKIEEYSVFQIWEQLQRKIFVSLETAEKLLRARYYGIEFQKVEVI